MRIGRRSALLGLGATSVAGLVRAQAPASAVQPLTARFAEAVRGAALPMDWKGGRFSGPGWDFLAERAASAVSVLFGEEHGIAETPRLAAQLFERLAASGFNRLVIETSPADAEELDAAARRGLAGVADLCRRDPPGPAFYDWREEAECLVRVRRALAPAAPAFWGIDYEIWWRDAVLIRRLQALAPPSARAALSALERACREGRERAAGGDFLQRYLISGDPGLVRAVRSAWRDAPRQALIDLETLEETVEINRLFAARQGYESNQRRAAGMRRNLLRYLAADRAAGARSRIMLKMGIEHMTRGLNDVGGFDVGSLVPELAAERSGTAFGVFVIAGANGLHAVNDVKTRKSNPEPVNDFEELGLALVQAAVPPEGFQVVDLRPARRFAANDKLPAAVARYVNGFDAMVVLNGCTASSLITG